MAKNKNEKKKWRPGRNLLTLILAVAILILVLIIIYIPTSITSNYNAGKVEYFQDVSSVSDLKDKYNTEKITYYDKATDYTEWNVKLEAYEYKDNTEEVFVADEYNRRVETVTTDDEGNENVSVTYENPYDTEKCDQINFSLTISLPEGKTDLSDYGTTGNYVIYAGLSIATNWIGDHATYSSAIKFNSNNILNSKTLTGKTITSKVSYPAKTNICWPVVKNIEAPDVYLYIYYKDSKGIAHQSVIRYEYREYMTPDTKGAIIKI